MNLTFYTVKLFVGILRKLVKGSLHRRTQQALSLKYDIGILHSQTFCGHTK